MGTLDYVTILLFAAGVMLAGVSFSSTGKNMKSFFAGGGNVPWWISGLSLFMGFFSAGTFVVWQTINTPFPITAALLRIANIPFLILQNPLKKAPLLFSERSFP